jgi:hypothetical protein
MKSFPNLSLSDTGPRSADPPLGGRGCPNSPMPLNYTGGAIEANGFSLALARQPALDETECPYHLEHAVGLGTATASQ